MNFIIQVIIRPVPHHREYQPEHSGTTNLDKDYCDKLRTSFYHSRKYRRKLSYYHPIMSSADEPEFNFKSEFNQSTRSSPVPTPPPSPKGQRARSPRLFTFPRRRLKILFF